MAGMKLVVGLVLVLVTWGATAASPEPGDPAAAAAVIASRDQVSVTLADFDAYVERKVPADKRAGLLRSGERILAIVGNLLLDKQLAAEARELGIDRDPMVADQLGKGDDDAVLAKVRMERYTSTLEVPDFSELARERYSLDPGHYAVPASTDIRQIVISTNGREESVARELAETVRAEAVANPDAFEALIAKHSDDPNKADTHGVMEDMEDPKYTPALRDAALALAEPGDISEPIRSASGFHILQLIQRTPERPRSFDEVREEMTAKMREEWLARQKQNHIDELRSMPVHDVDEDLLLSLQTRYAGEPTHPGS